MQPEDLVNNALDVLKRPRIASFYDGSPEAVMALDFYAQSRDSLLFDKEPIWARRDAVLAVSKQMPAGGYISTPWSSSYPELPWKYEYTLPVDCIKVLQVKQTPILIPEWRPRDIEFRVSYGTNVLLTNMSSAIATYIAQVLDPDLWYNDFQDLVIQDLIQRFAGPHPGADQDGNSNNTASNARQQSAG